MCGVCTAVMCTAEHSLTGRRGPVLALLAGQELLIVLYLTVRTGSVFSGGGGAVVYLLHTEQ